MSISIIIPTKNEQKNIPRLLKSIIDSETYPKEVILIDNFSQDNTRKLARQIWKSSQNDIPLRILKKGPERSTQKNFGAKKAKGKYFLFLDADMKVSPTLLSELERLIDKVKTATIPEISVGKDFWGKAIALERNLYLDEPLVTAPRFFEKKHFNKLSGFDENLIAGEDWDISIRSQKITKKTTTTQQAIYHFEPQGFNKNLQRKWYYTQHIYKYAKKHPQVFQKQSSLGHRLSIIWKNRGKLFEKPLHTTAFLIIKAIIYIRWKTQ